MVGDMRRNGDSVAACPNCHAVGRLRCTDSRPTSVRGAWCIRRRRRCDACGGAFTTYEMIAEAAGDHHFYHRMNGVMERLNAAYAEMQTVIAKHRENGQ